MVCNPSCVTASMHQAPQNNIFTEYEKKELFNRYILSDSNKKAFAKSLLHSTSHDVL